MTTNICCTCLSRNRKLFQLCRIPDGLNLLYALLKCDPDAYREGFYKDTVSWFVCWECRAVVNKIKQFRIQACTALKCLETLAENAKKEVVIKCLSHLSSHNIPAVPDVENSCVPFKQEKNHGGIPKKSETWIYDVPNYEDDNIENDNEDVTEPIKSKRRRLKTTKSDVSLKYPCSECDMTFGNKGTKWKHVQKHHRAGYKCTTCEKIFSFKHNLERHELSHSASHILTQCATCHKMVRVSLYAVHARTHVPRQPHTCAPCDKAFVCRATYESHLKYARAHATIDVFRYACDACDKRYRSRGELRDHIDYRHNNIARHKCPVCNKSLATRRCIARHVRRTHDGIKENPRDKMCDHCGKAFRDKKSLVEHVWIHTGARPLSCEICGRTFRQRAALHSHRRRLHNT